MPRRTISLLLAVAVVVVAIRQLESADTKPETARLRQQMVDRGVQYLLTKGQASDGSFSKQAGSGLTSICATALAAKRPRAERSGRGQELEVPGRTRARRRRHLHAGIDSQELRDQHRDRLLQGGQRRRPL